MTIQSIAQKIKSLFSSSSGSAPELPGLAIALGAPERTGMSLIKSTANIADTLSNHGIPTDAAEDGSENKTMVLVIAIVEEIFRALKEDANLQVSFKMGEISIIANGANGGGPMISKGFNINCPHGNAVIQ